MQKGHRKEKCRADSEGYCEGVGNPIGSGRLAKTLVLRRVANSTGVSMKGASVGGAIRTHAQLILFRNLNTLLHHITDLSQQEAEETIKESPSSIMALIKIPYYFTSL